MAIVNRRNAVLGYVVWSLGKRELQKRARTAMPTTKKSRRKPSRRRGGLKLLVPLAAVAGAAAWYWSRSGDDELQTVQ
jgi:hypothetical protein